MCKFIPEQSENILVGNYENADCKEREFIAMDTRGYYVCWNKDKTRAITWLYAKPLNKFKELKECYALGARFEHFDAGCDMWYCCESLEGEWIEPKWIPDTKYRILGGITTDAFKKHHKEIIAWWDGAEIEYYDDDGWKCWITLEAPSWDIDTKYRVKLPNLEVDTKMLVTDYKNQKPVKRHFSHFDEEGNACCWVYGRTSWSETETCSWEYWEIYKGK